MTNFSAGLGRSADDLDNRGVAKAYGRWAPIYDIVFGGVFDPGRKASIEAAGRVGGRVLDVGVGTGLSLADYARNCRVVGIDISEPMLRKALDRVRHHGLDHVDGIALMDAAALGFPDDTFDVVVAQFVIPAVPDPERTLDEFVRVTRPGGEIILANHIGAERGLRRAFEQAMSPLVRKLGWRPEFPWARIAGWAEGEPRVRLVERRPIPPLGQFALVRFAKTSQGRPAAVV